MALEDGHDPEGGKDIRTSPALIKSKFLENIVYIAAGRYHNIAVRTRSDKDNVDEDV